MTFLFIISGILNVLFLVVLFALAGWHAGQNDKDNQNQEIHYTPEGSPGPVGPMGPAGPPGPKGDPGATGAIPQEFVEKIRALESRMTRVERKSGMSV